MQQALPEAAYRQLGRYPQVRRFGIAGAALAALSAQLFLYVSTTIFLRRTFGLRLSRRAGFLALYLVTMLVVSGLLGRGGTDLNWHTLFLRAGVYVALSIGLALFLTRADLARLGELFRRRRVYQ